MKFFLLSTFIVLYCILVTIQSVCCETLQEPILSLITKDPDDLIVIGDDIGFDCNSSFPNSDRFKLFRQSQLIADQSDPTFNLFEVLSNASGTYTCQHCYQSTCSKHSEPKFIYVGDTFQNPMIIVKPRMIVLPRERITVTCSTSRSDIMILFYKDGTLVKEDIVVGNQSTYNIESAIEKDAGYYTCIYKTKPDSKYKIESSRSNPLWIRVIDLPRPSISFAVDQYEDGKMNIYCVSPYERNKSIWFQLLDGNKTVESETEVQKNNSTFTIDRPLNSPKKYYCLYRIRMGQDFAYSVISDPIIIGDVAAIDFTTGNAIRLLLSVLILVLGGIFIWKHCNHIQETEVLHKLPANMDNLDRYTEEPHAVYKSDPEEGIVVLETYTPDLANVSLHD